MRTLISNIAAQVLQSIEDNIAAGHDYEGNPYQYSANTFWRPFDQKLYAKIKSNPKLFTIIKNKNKLGMLIHGYGNLKRFINPTAANNFLTNRGSMLRNMQILDKTENPQGVFNASIGFTNHAEALKAFYLNISGAGKSRKLWKFLGITPQQLHTINSLTNRQFPNIALQNLKALNP